MGIRGSSAPLIVALSTSRLLSLLPPQPSVAFLQIFTMMGWKEVLAEELLEIVETNIIQGCINISDFRRRAVLD